MELSGKQLGPYTVADVIGHTRWGEVYRATQTAVNRLVALKVISLELMEEPGTVDRFLASARKAAQISFDGVVAVYEVGTASGVHYCAMELMDGPPLQEFLRKEGAPGHADEHRLLRMVVEMATTLETPGKTRCRTSRRWKRTCSPVRPAT